MRSLIDGYVRSLTEREDDPENSQDLGTFLTWLLRRCGYEIISAPVAWRGAKQRVSKGARQWGVDMIVVDPDGVYRLLVLKTGDISRGDWNKSTGGLRSDLIEATDMVPRFVDQLASMSEEKDASFPIEIVGVFNGELHDGVKEQAESALENMKSGCKRLHDAQFWDATHLVDMAVDALADGDNIRGDSDLFPPASRPWIRRVLDSIGDPVGSRWTNRNVTELAAAYLAGNGLTDGDGAPRPAVKRHAERAAWEFALVASMIRGAKGQHAAGSVLPPLDAIERFTCHLVDQWRDLPDEPGPVLAAARNGINHLLAEYLRCADDLAQRLEPIADEMMCLAIPVQGEPVDYPLRCYRLGGYLACAAQRHLDTGKTTRAAALTDLLGRLWTSNEGGFLQPVTDDQLIELWVILETFLRQGRDREAGRMAYGVLERIFVRFSTTEALPATRLRADYPMSDEALRILVPAHLSRRDSPLFEDSASLLVPVLVYVATRTGERPESDDAVEAFLAGGGEDATHARRLSLQSWLPPERALTDWYVDRPIPDPEHDGGRPLAHDGRADVYYLGGQRSPSAGDLCDQLEERNPDIGKSLAEKLGLPLIDRFAWKTTRTPPPFRLIIDTVQAASSLHGGPERAGGDE